MLGCALNLRNFRGGCLSKDLGFVERVQGRLDRLGPTSEEVARLAGLPAGFVGHLLDKDIPPPRSRRLIKLAEALSTSVSYLVGLDPDAMVPEEYLKEDQGVLEFLTGDEEALLQAYRRLDAASRAALLQVILKMAPGPDVFERKSLQAQVR